jgi:hypothetical protein
LDLYAGMCSGDVIARKQVSALQSLDVEADLWNGFDTFKWVRRVRDWLLTGLEKLVDLDVRWAVVGQVFLLPSHDSPAPDIPASAGSVHVFDV